jgi:hypothetical protein
MSDLDEYKLGGDICAVAYSEIQTTVIDKASWFEPNQWLTRRRVISLKTPQILVDRRRIYMIVDPNSTPE